MRTPISILLATLLPSLVLAAPRTPNGEIEERRVDGEDAAFLATALKDSGAAKEPAPEPGVSAAHPRLQVAKDFVYRMEAIVCREGAKDCPPLKLDAAKAKRALSIFRALGVKKTVPPKGTKAAKPYYFVKELVCGAETAAGAVPACGVSAHFHPKKE
jgi:hypothetical protein